MGWQSLTADLFGRGKSLKLEYYNTTQPRHWWDFWKYSSIKTHVLFINLSALFMYIGANLTLQWRHNGRNSVSNHQPYDCLLNRLFRRRSKKTSKLCVTGLCVRGLHRGQVNSPHKWPATRKMFSFDDVIMILPSLRMFRRPRTKSQFQRSYLYWCRHKSMDLMAASRSMGAIWNTWTSALVITYVTKCRMKLRIHS